MARKILMNSTALAVLAAAAAFALPAQAQVAEAGVNASVELAAAEGDQEGGRQGGWRNRDPGASGVQPAPERNWRRDDAGGANAGGERRAQARAEWQQRRDQQAPQAAPQEAAPQVNAPRNDWRSQRAPQGQRYGRNWDNDGAVSRPDPAYRGATPQVPDRDAAEPSHHRDGAWTGGDGTRNRTYSDPNRNGTHRGDHDRDRVAGNWRDRQGDRATIYRNGDHDGRSADAYRNRHDQNHAYRGGYNGYNGGYNGGYTNSSRDHRRWDHNHWRRDTRYNWSGYRSNHRDLYRAGRYYSPYSNYRYSRLNIGIFLNSGFYGNRYWINDPWQYRLPEVYGPYRWVRYYDDVLLVDIYSGEVVDVIHDFFW